MKKDPATVIARLEARIASMETLKAALDQEVTAAIAYYEATRGTEAKLQALVDLRMVENWRSVIEERLILTQRKLVRAQRRRE